MDCKICGKPLPEGSTVCKYCGAKQRVVETDTKPAAERRYSKKGLARRRMINTILIGVIALLSVAIVAGIVISVRPTSGKDEQDAQLSDAQTPTQDDQDDQKDDASKTDDPDDQKDDASKTDDPDDQKDDASKSDDPDDQKDDASKTDDPDDQKDDASKTADPDDKKDDASKTDDPDDKKDDASKTDDPDDKKDDASKSDDPDDKKDDASKSDDQNDKKDDASSQPNQTEPDEPQQTTVIKTGDYTATINRTAVDASLNHYRTLKLSINQTLLDGVEVSEICFTSSNPDVVRTEVVDGEGRAWGMALGKATVTGTVVLNTGETASASCEVTVVEYKEPPAEKPTSGSTGSGSSSGSSGSSSGNTGSTSSSDYILPGSDSKVYSQSDLKHLSSKELRLARNEIYARHGRIFSDPELQAYFEGKSWYHGTIQPKDFKDSMLNSVEKKNIETIQKLEG